MKKITFGTLAAAMAFAGSIAWAQTGTGDAAADKDAPKGPMAMFSAADANGDGAVTRDEILAFMAARQKAVDTDGDGFVTKEEMQAAMAERMKERIARMTDKRFERLDKDGDGKLSVAERDQSAKVDRMMKHLDKDGDGKISKAEAEEMMKQARDHHKRHDHKKRHGDHDGAGMDGAGMDGMGMDGPPADMPDMPEDGDGNSAE